MVKAVVGARLQLGAHARVEVFTTLAELAEHEGIAPSYMTRFMRLTRLAPDSVEAILDGKQGPEVTLAQALELFPIACEQQLQSFSRAKLSPLSTIAGTAIACSW